MGYIQGGIMAMVFGRFAQFHCYYLLNINLGEYSGLPGHSCFTILNLMHTSSEVLITNLGKENVFDLCSKL
jgi:hypothetical protein